MDLARRVSLVARDACPARRVRLPPLPTNSMTGDPPALRPFSIAASQELAPGSSPSALRAVAARPAPHLLSLPNLSARSPSPTPAQAGSPRASLTDDQLTSGGGKSAASRCSPFLPGARFPGFQRGSLSWSSQRKRIVAPAWLNNHGLQTTPHTDLQVGRAEPRPAPQGPRRTITHKAAAQLQDFGPETE